MLIPSLGPDLIANGLTPAEAQGCVLLLAHADLLDDVQMPATATTAGVSTWTPPERSVTNSCCPATQTPRSEPGAAVVPAPDAEVLDVAATTTDDLQQLAPHVPDKVRAAVEGADPDLEADLAAWAAGTRPHLRLLGPIQARTGTTGNPRPSRSARPSTPSSWRSWCCTPRASRSTKWWMRSARTPPR